MAVPVKTSFYVLLAVGVAFMLSQQAPEVWRYLKSEAM